MAKKIETEQNADYKINPNPKNKENNIAPAELSTHSFDKNESIKQNNRLTIIGFCIIVNRQ